MQASADKVFTDMCQALGAESLQGVTAQRVAVAAKALAQWTGINADALVATLSLERQQTVRSLFA